MLAREPDWAAANADLCELTYATFYYFCPCSPPDSVLRPGVTIEDGGIGMLQADFANRVIGGGVLRRGCVQEEIRFVICPELIASRLFCEELQDDEAVLITGVERFSNYSGYASSFKWTSDHIDATPRDVYGRIATEVVAIDALHFSDRESQFSGRHVRRELKKAFVGFASGEQQPPPVATGQWGCGAFGGDRELKALIQVRGESDPFHAGVVLCFET